MTEIRTLKIGATTGLLSGLGLAIFIAYLTAHDWDAEGNMPISHAVFFFLIAPVLIAAVAGGVMTFTFFILEDRQNEQG